MNSITLCAFADEASPALGGQIAALRRNGMQGLEIRSVDGENVSDLSLEKARQIRRRLEDAGLFTWALGSPIGKIDITDPAFPAHLEKLRHTLEVGSVLGARNLRMFSFYIPRGQEPGKYRDAVMERLARMAEAAKGSGILLCHENEKGIYGDNAARCLEIHGRFPEISGVFDPANFIQCGQDTAEAWALLKPFVRYMHVKDALWDGTVVPAGQGAGHVAEIVRDFRSSGGRVLTLEPHLQVFDGVSALERAGDTRRLPEGVYPDGDAAFDAAAEALKGILDRPA